MLSLVLAAHAALAAHDRGTWRASLRKYLAVVRVNVQNTLAYTMDAIGQGIFVMLFIFIFAHLWRATFNAQGVTEIAGLTLNQTIWYFVWAELIELTKIDVSMTIQNEVKDGSLAYTLGRPYNYLLYHFAVGIGGVGIRIVAVLLLGGLVAFLATGPLTTFNPLTIPILALITFLAFVLDYCVMALIGLSAFFVEDVSAFRLIYGKFKFVIGGLLLPVDFLPDAVASVVRLLPFNLVLYAPAKTFVAFDGRQVITMIGLQVVWIALFALLLGLAYRAGAKRVSINGG